MDNLKQETLKKEFEEKFCDNHCPNCERNTGDCDYCEKCDANFTPHRFPKLPEKFYEFFQSKILQAEKQGRIEENKRWLEDFLDDRHPNNYHYPMFAGILQTRIKELESQNEH